MNDHEKYAEDLAESFRWGGIDIRFSVARECEENGVLTYHVLHHLLDDRTRLSLFNYMVRVQEGE